MGEFRLGVLRRKGYIPIPGHLNLPASIRQLDEVTDGWMPIYWAGCRVRSGPEMIGGSLLRTGPG